eukprot:7381003-Prymnesium_polylepis.1
MTGPRAESHDLGHARRHLPFEGGAPPSLRASAAPQLPRKANPQGSHPQRRSQGAAQAPSSSARGAWGEQTQGDAAARGRQRAVLPDPWAASHGCLARRHQARLQEDVAQVPPRSQPRGPGRDHQIPGVSGRSPRAAPAACAAAPAAALAL